MNVYALPKVLSRVVRAYVTTLETLLIAGMVAVVAIAALQVFFRYIVGASLSWSEEALRYMMIWISSLGVGLAYSRGEMIGMNMLVDNLPRSLGMIIKVTSRLLILAAMIGLMIYGWEFAVRTGQGKATALPITMFWLHISIAVSATLIVLHVAASLIELLVGPWNVNSTPSESPQ